jgi:hypothetical protein
MKTIKNKKEEKGYVSLNGKELDVIKGGNALLSVGTMASASVGTMASAAVGTISSINNSFSIYALGCGCDRAGVDHSCTSPAGLLVY